MPKPWNKGLTKQTNSSVAKTSQTMRTKKIDNFSAWRAKLRKEGKLVSVYPPLKRNGNLAELIGVILGDGSIHAYARTEGLRIVSHSKNIGFIERYAGLVESVFHKAPSVIKRKSSNAVDIRLYQRQISKRLRVPTGSRSDLNHVLPSWIKKERAYQIRYLRGLYEAEGSYSVHTPTYTYKLLFSNHNPHLLNVVFLLLKKLGFHPHADSVKVQLSRREEIGRIMELLKFRKY